MTYEEIKNIYLDKSVDIDGSFGCQCFDLAMKYMMDIWGVPYLVMRWSGGVIDLAKHFEELFDTSKFEFTKNIPNDSNNFPPRGAVFVMGNGQLGHTGIIDSANAQTFTSLDQNWGSVGADGSGLGDRRIRLVTHDYSDMLGWITPKKNNNSNNNIMNKEELKNEVLSNIYCDSLTKEKLVNAINENNLLYMLNFGGLDVRREIRERDDDLNILKGQINTNSENYLSKINVFNNQISDLTKTVEETVPGLENIIASQEKTLLDYAKKIVELDAELQKKGSVTPANPSSTKNPWQSKKVWVAVAGIAGYVSTKYFGADSTTVTDVTTQLLQLLSDLGIIAIPTAYIAVQGSIDGKIK